MAAYTQFGYGDYPSDIQLHSSNADQLAQPGDASATGSATMNITNMPALSPCSKSKEYYINPNPMTRKVATASSTSTSGSNSGDNGQPKSRLNNQSAESLNPDALGQSHSNINTENLHTTDNDNMESANIIHSNNLSGSGEAGALSGGPCCENGRPIMTDPVSGQTLCSCQYDSARLALSSYSRLPAANVGVYGTPYPSTDQNPYQSIGVDSSAFYSPLNNPYALKDSSSGSEMTAWTSAGLQSTTGYYSYDPISAYGYSASYDLASRRKNATRESTATLKAWLNEHKKNPYPTKGEKIMLAIITKMTLTQVSTWFANARRRLKKENKMTWEPKNRTDEDDDGINSDEDKEKDEIETDKSQNPIHGNMPGAAERKDLDKDREDDKLKHVNEMRVCLNFPTPNPSYHTSINHPHSYHPYHQHPAYYQHQFAAGYGQAGPALMGEQVNKHEHSSKNRLSQDCGVPIPASKPKIWSLADTVACKTPPPPPPPLQQTHSAYMQQQQQQQQQEQQKQQQQQQILQQHLSCHPQQQQQQQQHQVRQLHPMQQLQHMSALVQQQLNNTRPSGSSPVNMTSSSSSGSGNGKTNFDLTLCGRTTYGTLPRHNHNITPSYQTAANTNTIVTDPTSATLMRHQQQQIIGTSQREVGFPEVHPDTPPQTPPNLKVTNLQLPTNLLIAATTAPMNVTYPNNININNKSNLYNNNNYNRFPSNYSPRDEESRGSSYASSVNSIENSPNAASNDGNRLTAQQQSHKMLFKSQQFVAARFVPPV